MPTAKKLISLIMALMIIVGMMSFVVSADEEEYPRVTYWNANSVGITIDITEDIDADSLAEAMTLTKNGEDVIFTVEKKIPTTTETLEDVQVRSTSYATTGYREALEPDMDYTYEICPEWGMEFDEMYILTISADILGAEWKKGITVKKLWMETFDNYDNIENTPWTASHIAKLSLEGDEDKYLKYEAATFRSAIAPAYKYVASSWVETSAVDNAAAMLRRNAVFADTGVAAKTYWVNGVKEREYNLEFDLKVQPSKKNANQHGVLIYMGDRTNYGARWSGSFVIAGTGYSKDRPVDKDNADITGEGRNIMYRMYSGTQNMFAPSRSTTSYGYQVNGPVALPQDSSTFPTADANCYMYIGGAPYTDDESEAVIATSVLTDSDESNDIVNRLSMSVKDHNIKFSITSPERSGFTSYDFTQGIADSSVNLGMPTIVFETADYLSSYYHIDNIIATKAEGYEVKGVTVTPENGSEDVYTDSPVSIDFGAPVNKSTVSNDTVKVYRDGEIDNEYQVKANEENPNIVDVIFADGMKNSAEYTVVLEGVFFAGDSTEYRFDPSQYHFTTIAPEVELIDFSTEASVNMAELGAGTYDVSATVMNNRIADGAQGVLTICLYDEYMTMIDFKVKRINIPMGETDTISDSWEITEQGKYTATCYLWDSFGGMDVTLVGALE